MPNLTIREGGREVIFDLEEDQATIGRSDANTIEILDAKASKEHCRVERIDDRWKVVDLESKNGTRVNGAFCNKAWLNHGDTIQIGHCEIRFGSGEGGRAAAPVRSRKSAPARRPAPVPAARREYDDDEGERPPPRRKKEVTPDKMLVWGLVVLGAVIVVVVANAISSSLEKDVHNLKVLENAELLVQRGEWDEALDYLQKNGDPEGNAYFRVEQRIQEVQTRKGAYYENQKEEQARTVVSKLGRKVKAYHRGKQSAQPEDILKLVERLKTDLAGTEHAREARKRWPAWFQGRVPERAVERMSSTSKLRKDWDDAVARANEYRKDERFREARETIERFVTAREAILEQADLDEFRRLRDHQLRVLDGLADSVYRAKQRLANNFIKQKRYDQAIRAYSKVIETFGIDFYVRKAQEEIQKIQAMKGN